jgi:hypothetical protein
MTFQKLKDPKLARIYETSFESFHITAKNSLYISEL